LDVVKTPYTSYSECGCQVHKGFYDAEQKVLGGILTEVKRLKSLPFLSSYAVKTTGHSLGAALALLTAMGEIMNPFGVNISAYIYCLQSFSIRSH
jgi:predicted lipase